MVTKHVLDIIFLQETKNQEPIIKNLILSLKYYEMEIINPTGVVGTAWGLVLACSSKVTVNKTDSQIDVIVTCNSSNLVWMTSSTYGCPCRIRKHTSWEYFKNISRKHTSWDLNFTLSGDEKRGGIPVD